MILFSVKGWLWLTKGILRTVYSYLLENWKNDNILFFFFCNQIKANTDSEVYVLFFRLFQVAWLTQTGYIYNRNNFSQVSTFRIILYWSSFPFYACWHFAPNIFLQHKKILILTDEFAWITIIIWCSSLSRVKSMLNKFIFSKYFHNFFPNAGQGIYSSDDRRLGIGNWWKSFVWKRRDVNNLQDRP